MMTPIMMTTMAIAMAMVMTLPPVAARRRGDDADGHDGHVGGHGHDGEGVVKVDAAVTLLLAAVRLTRPSDHSECLAGNHPHRKYFRHFVVAATVRICFPMEERISLGSRGF